jgi:hypothetical protein
MPSPVRTARRAVVYYVAAHCYPRVWSRVPNYNIGRYFLRDKGSGQIVVILRNPVGSDPAKVVNVDGALGENDRYAENASERHHADRYPDPSVYH